MYAEEGAYVGARGPDVNDGAVVGERGLGIRDGGSADSDGAAQNYKRAVDWRRVAYAHPATRAGEVLAALTLLFPAATTTWTPALTRD